MNTVQPGESWLPLRPPFFLGRRFGSELGPRLQQTSGQILAAPPMSSLGVHTLFFEVSVSRMGLVITPI